MSLVVWLTSVRSASYSESETWVGLVGSTSPNVETLGYCHVSVPDTGGDMPFNLAAVGLA